MRRSSGRTSKGHLTGDTIVVQKGKNVPLITKPTIRDFNRAELEARIELIRARRMLVAFDYHASQKIDIEQQTDKVVRKFKEHGDLLGKELDRLDRTLEAVEKRVAKMSELQQEHGLLQDLLAQV